MSIPPAKPIDILSGLVKWSFLVMPIIGIISLAGTSLFLKLRQDYEVNRKKFIWASLLISMFSLLGGVALLCVIYFFLLLLEFIIGSFNLTAIISSVSFFISLMLMVEALIIKKVLQGSFGKSLLFSVVFNWPIWVIFVFIPFLFN